MTDPLSNQQLSPEARVVNAFHKFADVDKSSSSIHHTLGKKPGQAAEGGHGHPDLLNGVTFTGNINTNTVAVLKQVLSALELLGAVDATV
jgi:hypothetical protein